PEGGTTNKSARERTARRLAKGVAKRDCTAQDTSLQQPTTGIRCPSCRTTTRNRKCRSAAGLSSRAARGRGPSGRGAPGCAGPCESWGWDCCSGSSFLGVLRVVGGHGGPGGAPQVQEQWAGVAGLLEGHRRVLLGGAVGQKDDRVDPLPRAALLCATGVAVD